MIQIETPLFENPRIQRIWMMAKFDFIKRYHKNRFGLVWALLNPLFRISIYYLVFTQVFQIREENFALILFSGLIAWMTFSESTNRGIGILNTKSYLIENIQFNKVDLYISFTISVFLGFFFNLFAYMIISSLAGITFSYTLIYLPILFLCLFLICMGTTMILSIVNIYFKDIEHFWTLFLVFGFWTAGVFQRSEVFIEAFPALKYLHPFLGIILNFRNILVFNQSVDWFMMGYGLLYATLILLTALWFFKTYSDKAMEKI